jgi:hypothetical protein
LPAALIANKVVATPSIFRMGEAGFALSQ